MIENKPKGIRINKNALNIVSNNDIRTRLQLQLNQQPQGKPGLINVPINPVKITNENDQPQLQLKAVGDDEIAVAKASAQAAPLSRIPKLSLKLSQPLFKPIHNNKPESAERDVEMEIEEEIEDIDDVENSDNSRSDAILQVSDLAKDIYQYMNDLECVQSVRRDYLKEQKILTPKVRQRLINWCIEVHSNLKLLPETLYMTIAVIDRYFDRYNVTNHDHVQLVGVGAIMVASKYEEIYPPDMGDLVHLTRNAYSRRDILRIEIDILERLDFDLGKPIPLAFLRRFSKAAHCDLKMHSIAKYLMELSLTEYECCHWRPSMLAAAALFVSIHLVRNGGASTRSSTAFSSTSASRRPALDTGLSRSPAFADRWTKSLVHYTTYTREQLQEPAATLCKILKRARQSPHNFSCNKKYTQEIVKWSELKSSRVDELIRLS